MPRTLSQALFSRLLRSTTLRETLGELHELSGMDALFLDGLGNERVSRPRHSRLGFRRLAAREPGLESRMVQARMHRLTGGTGRESFGLIEIVQALRVEGEVTGYWVLSAGRSEDVSPDDLRQAWIQTVKQGGDVTWAEWERAWLELPVVTPSREAAWKRCMELFAEKAMAGFQTPRAQVPDMDGLPPRILTACRVCRERYMESLHLKEVAAVCQVSPEHLSRTFHQHTGLRFREYLAEIRVEAACEALEQSGDRISDIAGRCGFSTLSRFNRCFRDIRGMTPREWRKRAHLSPA